MQGKLTVVKGFSLIELMIAVAIVTIIAAIAYPAYTDQVQKNNRSDAKVALMQLSQAMQRLYTEENSYISATLGGGGIYPSTSPEGYYTLSISDLDATTYTLTATPVAGAPTAKDSKCTSFSLTSTNIKSATGTLSAAKCWK